MLVPVKWLKEYVDIEAVEIKDLNDRLVMSGSNTEEVVATLKGVSGVKVGKIEKIDRHPDADKLLVLQVNLGEETVQIVTGAQNCFEGAYIPVATVGAILADGTKIKKGKLRGQESRGMLCSLEELGFDKSVVYKDFTDGIWLLEGEPTPGSDISEIDELADHVIEFEITPNRPDCLSVLGMARETAATFDKTTQYPKCEVKGSAGNAADHIDIKIEAEDLCSRFAGRIVKDVVIKPSPQWMQIRLMKAGMRPINNIVDITNYVLLEYGQPIHAYDLETLEDSKIVVKRAEKGEKFTTLDDVERELTEDMLMIADGKRSIGIAGIMGGQNTEVSDTTTSLMIEVANFNKTNIRKTSKDLGLRSEASNRFEKGVSPSNVLPAINRVCELIELLEAGTVIDGIVDEYPVKEEIITFDVRVDKVNNHLGLNLSSEAIAKILDKLEIKCELNGNIMTVTPPDFRLDLLKEVDIIEEVARLYGYDNIPRTLPAGRDWGARSNGQQIEYFTMNALNNLGLNEITTYSFVSPRIFDQIGVAQDSILRRVVELRNPLGEEYSIMRTTLVPNMLEVIAKNINRGVKNVSAFEIGNTFIPREIPVANLPIEKKMMVMGMVGQDVDFFTIKGVVTSMLDKLGIDAYKFVAEKNNKTYHPGRCATILWGNHIIGTIGEVHPKVAENYDIEEKTYVADIDFNILLQGARIEKIYKAIPKYPSSTRDIALLVKDEITSDQIKEVIVANGGKLLESCEIFDVYKGKQIEAGYKSVAYALEFRSSERTLVEEDVNKAISKILKKLESELEAQLR